MDLFELEELRKKSLLRFFIYVFVFLLSSGGMIYLFCMNIAKFGEWGMHWIFIIIGIILVTYIGYGCAGIAKKYENAVKQTLMKKILDNIVQNDGEVNWEANDFDEKRYSSDGELPSFDEINENKLGNIEAEEDLEKRVDKLGNFVDNQLKIYENLSRSTMVVGVFGAYLDQDDIFWGNYKGVKFASVEAHDTASKNHAAVFNGTLLEIELKENYENTVLFLRKKFFVSDSWYSSIKKGLKKLKIDLPIKRDFEIFADTPDNISNVISSNLINFLNNTNTDYSYLIKENNMYVIMPHGKDKYKLGNLFKSLERETQNSKIVQDIKEILYITEQIGNIGL